MFLHKILVCYMLEVKNQGVVYYYYYNQLDDEILAIFTPSGPFSSNKELYERNLFGAISVVWELE